MKILIVNDKFLPEPTTVGRIIYNVSRILLEKGQNPAIFTTFSNKQKVCLAKPYLEEFDGINIYKIPKTSESGFFRFYLTLFNPFVARAFKKVVSDIKPDVIHFHNIHQYLCFPLIKIAKKSGAKVFLTAHDVMPFHYGKLIEFINSNDLSCPNEFNYKISPWRQIKRFKKRYNPFRSIIIRHYLKCADKIFAVSNALKDALTQNGINNVEVIYNGIDIGEWQIDRGRIQEFREKHNLANKKVVLFGGRLSELKGGRQAVLAIEKVVKEIPNAALLVMGEINNYAKEMLKIAEKLGIKNNNIIFTGWLSGDELKSAYWSSDAAITPSICFDSFPTIILEALACGKPVVATCFGGAREIVIDGETGYVVNPFNTELMAEKIIDLLMNEEKAREFGLAGYQRVKENFSLEKQAEETLAWYYNNL